MSFSNFLDVPSQMPKPCLKEGECCKIGSDPSAVHLKQQMFLKKFKKTAYNQPSTWRRA